MATRRERAEAAVLRWALGRSDRTRRRLAGAPVTSEGQVLETEAQLLLRLQRMARVPGVEDLSVAEGRRLVDHQAAMVGGEQPISAVRDLQVAGREARLYQPSRVPGTGPLLVFFHGGGWVFGSLDSHDAVCRFVASTSTVPVLSVDYRLAPEHPFPAAYDDCLAAYRWVVDNAHEVGADPERIAVGGDSAGGALAASVALEAARAGLPLALQWLVYPAADMTGASASRRTYAEGYYLTEGFMALASRHYLPDEASQRDPVASPLFADIPPGLAPAYVATAGFDPLRDEGEAYARRMADAGVEVELRRFEGQIHSFFNLVGVGRTARDQVAEMAQALGRGLT